MRRLRRRYLKEYRYDKIKLSEERDLCKKYGMANKKEYYKLKEIVRRTKRALRKESITSKNTRAIIQRYRNFGFFNTDTDETLYEKILNELQVSHLLQVRLQTRVINQGYTVNGARQKIVHGKVRVTTKKSRFVCRSPNYLLNLDKKIEIL